MASLQYARNNRYASLAITSCALSLTEEEEELAPLLEGSTASASLRISCESLATGFLSPNASITGEKLDGSSNSPDSLSVSARILLDDRCIVVVVVVVVDGGFVAGEEEEFALFLFATLSL